MPIRPSATIILAGIAALLLSACDRSSGPQDSNIGADAPDLFTAHGNDKMVFFLASDLQIRHQTAQMQMVNLLAQRQTGISARTLDAGADAAKQAEQLREAVTTRPFALLVQPVDAKAIAAILKEARTAGIRVIGIGQGMTGQQCDSVIYCDQQALGKLAGEIALRALSLKSKEKGRAEVTGRVVQIRGEAEGGASALRGAGFLAVLQAQPGVVLVHDAPGFWKKEEAAARMKEALRLQTTFDIVYAHDDLMALGARQAAGQERENMLIIGTDAFSGPEGGLTLIRDGDIDASIYQPLLVDFAWGLLMRMLREPDFTPKPAYELKPQPVTPKNISEVIRSGWQPAPEM